MSHYSFSNEAVKDLNDICSYIAQNDPQAANRLFDQIRQKCKLIANFPSMGKTYEKLAAHLRGFIVDDYIVFYYPKENGIDVVRVVSGYRDLEQLFSVDREG
jgi:toxin ParE1/3/4